MVDSMTNAEVVNGMGNGKLIYMCREWGELDAEERER